jgi:hypothetical protein
MRSTAALAIGLTLLTFGAMITLVGGILSGICLAERGSMCQGNGIGSIGFGMLAFGVPMILIGIPLFMRGRKILNAPTAPQPDARTSPVEPEGARAATECPHCGAPIAASATVCEFCGGYLR